MQSMSHREYLTWIAWLDDQWNTPDKTDHYLMQIAGYVSHVMSKKSWQPGDYKIKFQSGTPNQTKQDRDTKTAKAKSVWGSRIKRGKR